MDENNSHLKDISSIQDIEYIIREFYGKAIEDPAIGTFFTEIARIDLEDHIPHISSFWHQQLFYTGNYKKNVLQIHKDLHLKKSITKIHFDTWLALFTATIDKNFRGQKSNLMKTRALSIATVIQIKLR